MLGAVCPPCTVVFDTGCEPCPDTSLPECQGCQMAQTQTTHWWAVGAVAILLVGMVTVGQALGQR